LYPLKHFGYCLYQRPSFWPHSLMCFIQFTEQPATASLTAFIIWYLMVRQYVFYRVELSFFMCYLHKICGLKTILLSLVTRLSLIIPISSWGQFVWDLWWVKCKGAGFPPHTKVFPSQFLTHLHFKSYSLKTIPNRKIKLWSLETLQLKWCCFINQGSRNKCSFIVILMFFKGLSKKCPHVLTFILLWWAFKF